MGFLKNFSEPFAFALALWPFVSMLLTVPVLALLYHRDNRIRLSSAIVAYGTVLYLLSLQSAKENDEALSDEEFADIFTADKPVLFAYHSYAHDVRGLIYDRRAPAARSRRRRRRTHRTKGRG